MTKLTKEEVLKIYDRVYHYHFQQPHQINNILTVAAEIQDAYKAKNADQLRDAERLDFLEKCSRDGYDAPIWACWESEADSLRKAIDDEMKESK